VTERERERERECEKGRKETGGTGEQQKENTEKDTKDQFVLLVPRSLARFKLFPITNVSMYVCVCVRVCVCVCPAHWPSALSYDDFGYDNNNGDDVDGTDDDDGDGGGNDKIGEQEE